MVEETEAEEKGIKGLKKERRKKRKEKKRKKRKEKKRKEKKRNQIIQSSLNLLRQRQLQSKCIIDSSIKQRRITGDLGGSQDERGVGSGVLWFKLCD